MRRLAAPALLLFAWATFVAPVGAVTLGWTITGGPSNATAYQSTTYTFTATNVLYLNDIGCVEIQLPPSYVIDSLGTPQHVHGEPWSVDDLHGELGPGLCRGRWCPARPPRVGDVHGDRNRHPAGQLQLEHPCPPTARLHRPGARAGYVVGIGQPGSANAHAGPDATPATSASATAAVASPAHPDATRSAPQHPAARSQRNASPIANPGRLVASDRNATPHARGRRGRPRAAPGGSHVRPARGPHRATLGLGHRWRGRRNRGAGLARGPARVVRARGGGRWTGLAHPAVHRAPGGRGHGLDSCRATDER